jgi:flagellar motor switch protein FliG
MSMLNRFRKPGGFQQLLLLLETCEPGKQQSLMKLLGSEDPGWAHLVKLKSLSFSRILSWPTEILMEITAPLPDRVLATIYFMAGDETRFGSPPLKEKWSQSMPSMKSREVQEMARTQSFSPAEQMAATIKLIQTVRELESKGQLRLASFDPALEIDKRIAV